MSSLSKLSDKIVSRQRLSELLAEWSHTHKKIVFTNGIHFDEFHAAVCELPVMQTSLT